jgi:hypothetical protein
MVIKDNSVYTVLNFQQEAVAEGLKRKQLLENGDGCGIGSPGFKI